MTKNETKAKWNLIKYEFKMLRATAENIHGTGDYQQPQLNAFLESFLIHARNLITLFFIEGKGDDITARDFLSDKGQAEWADYSLRSGLRKQYLCKLLRPINKRLAHITSYRLKHSDKEWFTWDIWLNISYYWDKFLSIKGEEK